MTQAATQSFESMLDSVLNTMSETLNRLNFPPNPHKHLTYSFPNLVSPPERRLPRPHTFTPLVRLATQKYLYNKTQTDDWDEFIQFPNRRLVRSSGEYKIVEGRSKKYGDHINDSKEGAVNWVETEFIPFISHVQGSAVMFATGEPGSGKSTLFKFLINKQRSYLIQHMTIVSRFESLKFRDFCSSFKDEATILEHLKDYILQILFRDIIFNLGYTHLPGRPGIRRSQTGPFCPQLIGDLLFEMGSTSSEVETDIMILIESLDPSSFDHKKLLGISQESRRAVVTHFARNYKLCVLFDGLDYASISDSMFDPDTFRVLSILINSTAFHGAASKDTATVHFPFDFHSLFVMRNSTFTHLFEDKMRELKTIEYIKWDIAPVPTDVVLFNAIRRGFVGLHREKFLEGGNAEALAQTLMAAVDRLLRFVDAQLGIPIRRRYGVLEFFNGNLRSCFEFLARLISWLMHEAHIRGQVHERKSSLANAIEFLASDHVAPILHHRRYRLIEFLLFHEGWSFENSVYRTLADAGDLLAGRTQKPGELRSNQAYSGFVDNIFNYHIERHADHPDRHCLLEKIRLLQTLLDSRPLTASEIGREMQKTFGYSITDDENRNVVTLGILLNGGFIDMHTEGRRIVFSATRKARATVNRLIEQQAYLEHVFHKTLLPDQLVSHTLDAARSANLDSWIVASIRNSFILLCYIGFVEGNKAGNKQVPKQHQVFSRIQSSLKASLERILRQDHIEKRNSPPDAWLVSKVQHEINNTVVNWLSAGILLPIPAK